MRPVQPFQVVHRNVWPNDDSAISPEAAASLGLLLSTAVRTCHLKWAQQAPWGFLLARSTFELTDDEATFLSLLVRIQPATAYQLSKVYADSPVSNFGTSKGKIYPLAKRLKSAGLLTSRPVNGDGRNSEVLRATARGRGAVRKWVKQVKPAHLLPEDPLRIMVQSFDLLTKDEQLRWIADVKTGLEAKLAQLEDYGAAVHVPFQDQVHDNAVTSVEMRLDWLDRLRKSIVGRRISVRSGTG